MKSKLLQYTVNTDAVKDRMLALGMTITQLAKATGLGNQRIYRKRCQRFTPLRMRCTVQLVIL